MAFESILSQYLGLQKQGQDIQAEQAETQLRQAQTQSLLKKMNQEDESAKAIQDLALATRKAADRNTPPDGVGPPPMGEIASTMKPLDDGIKSATESMKMNRAVAQELRGTNLKASEMADKAADSEAARIAALQKEKTAAEKDFTGRIASVAGSATPDSFDQTVESLNTLMGPKWADKANVDRDLLQRPVWGAKTAAYMENLRSQGLTANEQAIRKQAADNAIETAKRDSATVDAHNETKHHNDQTDARARERIGIERDRLKLAQDKDAARTRKLDKTEAAIKDPNSTMVKTYANKMAKDLKLSPEDASKAAVDLLRKKAELMKGDRDLSADEAEDQALEEITDSSKYTPPKEGKAGAWYNPLDKGTKAEPAHYKTMGAAKGGGPKTAEEYLSGN
jgi:hypothetical protein